MLSFSKEASMKVFGIVLCLIYIFLISDAAEHNDWIVHSDDSVDFNHGQMAKLFWSANLGSGNWGAVTIFRGQEKSNTENVIQILSSTGQKTKHLNGRDADLDVVVQGSAQVFNVTFTLKNLKRNTDQMYYKILVTTDQFDTAAKYTFLRVLVLPGIPSIQILPNKQVFCISNTVNITCIATVGYPTNTNLTLYRNNQIIKTVHVPRTENDKEANATIEIPLTSGVHSFSCKAENSAGLSEKRSALNITAKDPPVILNCKNATAVEGSPLSWTCSASGSPQLTTSWYKGNTVISSEKTLKLTSVKKADAGIYTFIVSNGDECPTASTTVYLTVQCSSRTEPPTITDPASKDCKSISVNEKDDVSIMCHATGVPNPAISWKKHAQALGNCSSLILTNVERNQAGNYTCTADNGIGKPDTACWNVNVKYFQGCKEKALDQVTISGVIGQCVSVPRDGNPVPTMSCSPEGNLDITQKDGEYSLCGVKGDTVSNCTIANDVGRCSFLVKSYQQIDKYVYKGRFTCSSCNYDKALDDSSSAVFKTTKEQMETMLKSAYEGHKHVTSIEVIHFRTGSVIVVFQLHLVANVSNPLSPLKEALIKNAGTLNGLMIDPCSIQQGDDTPSTCQSASSITPCTERSQVPALVLGVILGVSLIVNFIFIIIGYFVWKHMKENKERPNGRNYNNDDSGYANAIALQDQPPSDSQDVVQYATVGNEREQESPNTAVYQSVKPHSDTYSSLSPSTKLPPKPAVITNSGDYQDLQGAPRHYQSLDNFSRV